MSGLEESRPFGLDISAVAIIIKPGPYARTCLGCPLQYIRSVSDDVTCAVQLATSLLLLLLLLSSLAANYLDAPHQL